MTLLVLIGPTGVGKTELSLRLAEAFDTCIVSADSRQLYAELKIGTAAPTEEQLRRVKHYMVGTLGLTDYYSAAQYEAEVMKLDNILRKMKKTEQRIYAIEQTKIKLEKELKEVQKKWFHRKEKKELEQKISGKQRELSKSKDTLRQIPRMNGYENALEVKKAYKAAKRELDKVRKQQNAWDQAMKPSEKMYLVIRANRLEQTKKRSIHERLEEKKQEAAQQQREERIRSYNRDCL